MGQEKLKEIRKMEVPTSSGGKEMCHFILGMVSIEGTEYNIITLNENNDTYEEK